MLFVVLCQVFSLQGEYLNDYYNVFCPLYGTHQTAQLLQVKNSCELFKSCFCLPKGDTILICDMAWNLISIERLYLTEVEDSS